MKSKSSKASCFEDKNVSKREARLWMFAKICAFLCVFLPTILGPIVTASDPLKAAHCFFIGLIDVLTSFPYNLVLVVLVISGVVALLSYIRPPAERIMPVDADQSSGSDENN